jgi:hypothetical protein
MLRLSKHAGGPLRSSFDGALDETHRVVNNSLSLQHESQTKPSYRYCLYLVLAHICETGRRIAYNLCFLPHLLRVGVFATVLLV